jgi:hypothetical protein
VTGRNKVDINFKPKIFTMTIMHEFASLQSCKSNQYNSMYAISKFLTFLTTRLILGPMFAQAIYPFPSSYEGAPNQ